jgi:predicted enzyme related to lactoylglutathione lyase
MANRAIVHLEISAKDLHSAGDFYRELFGWKVDHQPEFNYTTFQAEGGPGGGFNMVSDQQPAGTVVPYVASEDIDADLAKAESLGAKIMTPKTEIPGTGWFGIFIDPTGNRVGLYTPVQTVA